MGMGGNAAPAFDPSAMAAMYANLMKSELSFSFILAIRRPEADDQACKA